jgi:hypothetical protein
MPYQMMLKTCCLVYKLQLQTNGKTGPTLSHCLDRDFFTFYYKRSNKNDDGDGLDMTEYEMSTE